MLFIVSSCNNTNTLAEEEILPVVPVINATSKNIKEEKDLFLVLENTTVGLNSNNNLLDIFYAGTMINKTEVGFKNEIINIEKDIDLKQNIYYYNISNSELQDNITELILTSIATDTIPIIDLGDILVNDIGFDIFINNVNIYNHPVIFRMPTYEKNQSREIFTKNYKTLYNTIKKGVEKSIVNYNYKEISYNKDDFFYPGNNFVDLISLDFTIKNEIDIEKSYNDLDYIYYKFQSHKPLLVNFKVSHYDTIEYKYKIDFAVDTIEEFYRNIYFSYPNITGVLYENDKYIHIKNKVVENFSLDNNKVANAYRNAIMGIYLKKDNKTVFYKYDINLDMNNRNEIKNLNDYVKENNLNYTVDREKKLIVIKP